MVPFAFYRCLGGRALRLGALRLAEAIRGWLQLQVIDLRVDGISTRGAQALIEAALDCPSVKRLRLKREHLNHRQVRLLRSFHEDRGEPPIPTAVQDIKSVYR